MALQRFKFIKNTNFYLLQLPKTHNRLRYIHMYLTLQHKDSRHQPDLHSLCPEKTLVSYTFSVVHEALDFHHSK